MKNINILDHAKIPEHSIHFMQAVSGGKAFVENNYLCFSSEDWLTIIGYPLHGSYCHESFLKAKQKAVSHTNATTCFAIAPDLPLDYHGYIEEKDVFYTLSVNASIPQKLVNPIKKATMSLTVEMGCTFTAEHRRLWTEFMSRVPLNSKVRSLFAATANVISQKIPELYLLNAWDENGHLVASLLLDFAPKDFCAYILGAHSKTYYTPHAADLLFSEMIEISKNKGKQFIHLGLGVNEGITKFKQKWGGQKSLPFLMASWQEQGEHSIKFHTQTILNAVANEKQRTELLDFIGKSKYKIWADLPQQRPFAMIWEIKKNDRISWIGGSAHFFCYSFEHAFRQIFEKVDTVLFEGPLDEVSLKIVEANGRDINEEYAPLFDLLSASEIKKLRRMVCGPEDFLGKLFDQVAEKEIDVLWYLKNTRPWTALFTLWTAFLERNGWKESVDLEAWHLAHGMGKTVIAMESIEEQLASLNSVPPDRVVRYFQNCSNWPKMIRKNVKAYLNGDLSLLMGTTAEFPTRTETIISKRDERFRQRMRPFIEQGRCMVFVGSAHMINLRHMLEEDGFTVTKVYPTLKHKFFANFRKADI